jgi:diguanylate cyclase (GGDEF)-like protein
MLTRFQPDVILMDAMMPVMDGFTACARMQELPNGADIPVLMITALQDNSSVERAFAAGASDYIPKPIHYAVLSQRVRRIIEANRAEKRIRHLAYNDVLTNLPNRTLFFELLAKSIDHARSAGQQVAVLFMDLDRFKYVNDNLGHAVGDRLLQAVAQRVRQTVRSADAVARLGGDEFTVVLNELDSPASAASAAHNIVRALSAPFPIDGHEICHRQRRHRHVPARRRRRRHAGQARRQRHVPRQAHQHRLPVLRIVDGALDLRARAAGERPAPRHGTAAPAGSLLPAAGLPEQRPHHRHGSAGALAPSDARHDPPAEFIPLAEETGIINQFGDWVLRTACAQLRQFMRNGLPELRVAVNLSVRQLLQKTSPPRWKRCWPTPACRRTCWNWKSPKAR